jgi:uncharacterized protein
VAAEFLDAEAEALSDEELAGLPVFPLPRVVLLPGGVLPLHLFEPRYRMMASDCTTRGPAVIAMAMLAPGWEGDYEGRPAIRPIAGAGRIVAHRRNPDGSHDLVLEGVARVRLAEVMDAARPYRVARATVLADEDEDEPGLLRRALEPVLATAASLAALERRSALPALDLRGPVGSVVDRLAERWVHDAPTRQEILEALSVPARVALVGDALVGLLARAATAPGGSAGGPAN